MMIPTKRLMDFDALQVLCIEVEHLHSGDCWCNASDHANHNTSLPAFCDAEDCPVWNGLRKSTKARDDTLIEIRAATLRSVDSCMNCKHQTVDETGRLAGHVVCALITSEPYEIEDLDSVCGLHETIGDYPAACRPASPGSRKR